MAGFLYFIPGNKAVEKKELIELGFQEIYGKEILFRICGTNTGPQNGEGCVVAMTLQGRAGKQAKTGYYPETQTWIKCPGKDYWIGFEKQNPPTPEDLERKEIIDGYIPELEDGNLWIIPIARSIEGNTLPEVLALGLDGQIVKEIIPRFLSISRQAERAWQAIREECEKPVEERKAMMDSLEAIGIAINTICLNYTLDKTHVLLLKIISTRNVASILNYLVDFPAMQEAVAVLNERESGKEPSEIKKKSQPTLNGAASVAGEKVC